MMKYPKEAIEACDALAHPLPHPSTDDVVTAWVFKNDHGEQVDTQHPGPIEMHEPDERIRWDVYGAVLLIGILCGFGLVFASGQVAELAIMAGR